jgi:hypothetical protein
MIRYCTYILYFPMKLLFIVTWAKKKIYDKYKVNSTWSWDVSSLFFLPRIKY